VTSGFTVNRVQDRINRHTHYLLSIREDKTGDKAFFIKNGSNFIAGVYVQKAGHMNIHLNNHSCVML
jgi:hypothetical protein